MNIDCLARQRFHCCTHRQLKQRRAWRIMFTRLASRLVFRRSYRLTPQYHWLCGNNKVSGTIEHALRFSSFNGPSSKMRKWRHLKPTERIIRVCHCLGTNSERSLETIAASAFGQDSAPITRYAPKKRRPLMLADGVLKGIYYTLLRAYD